MPRAKRLEIKFDQGYVTGLAAMAVRLFLQFLSKKNLSVNVNNYLMSI